MITDDPEPNAPASAKSDTAQAAGESATASASRVAETDSQTITADPNDAVVVASTEILQSSTVADATDDSQAQAATVIGAEQVLQLSPAATRAANDVPKLLNSTQVFQTTQAGSISQQVIGATDADGRFFLFSPSASSTAATSGNASEQAAAAAVVSAAGTSAEEIGRSVPGLLPGVQFAQAQGGQQFYLMVPAAAQSAATQETTVAAAAATTTAASGQAQQRAIAPRGGTDQTVNVSVTMKAPTVSRAMRDERRRSTHNEVERRRRDKINAWISELAKIIPDCQEDTTKQGQSKGSVLAKTVDYIHELQTTNARLAEMLQDHEQSLVEKQMLKARVADVEKENVIMKNKLNELGIEVVTQTQAVTTEVISTSEQGSQ